MVGLVLHRLTSFPTPVALNLFFVAFVGAAVALLAGLIALAQIWHTGTAGSAWQLQWQGPGSPLTISATDPAHAWALLTCPAHQRCDRELLATTDGGRHWHVTATLPTAVDDVNRGCRRRHLTKRSIREGLGACRNGNCLRCRSTSSSNCCAL